MKVANNMDSVFAGFTEKELEFDAMFDEDDCLIDLIAGVDESGELLTGPNPEDNYEFKLDENGEPLNGLTFDEFIKEADDPITDKCDDGRREGTVKDAGNAPEGAEKDQDAEFNTPEGMKSEIPGSNNSAESHAHDVTKDIENAIKENNEEGPIEDKDADALRDGKEKYASNNVEGEKQEVIGAAQEATEETCKECGKPLKECQCAKKEAANESVLVDLMMEGFDPSSETDAEFKIGNDQGPIEDKESDELRSGKEKDASSNVEGEKQEVIGAAQEGCEGGDCGNIDKQLSDGMNDATVPDKVQTDGDANIIPPDRDTQSSDGVEPASENVVYSGWITKVTEAEEKVPLSSDDADIEAVEKGSFDSEGSLDLDVNYDDDELIDIAINGGELY
ncbi:MAG: hypothetical protein IKR19_08425 [Acholeplasmatales bacterium]|nr:hypothetical protein [Acholeplasmatales bacterium]